MSLEAWQQAAQVQASVTQGIKPGANDTKERTEKSQESCDDPNITGVTNRAPKGLDDKVNHEDDPIATNGVPSGVSKMKRNAKDSENHWGPDVRKTVGLKGKKVSPKSGFRVLVVILRRRAIDILGELCFCIPHQQRGNATILCNISQRGTIFNCFAPVGIKIFTDRDHTDDGLHYSHCKRNASNNLG